MESEYNTHTSTGSMASIFTFVATFIVCLVLLDNTAGPFTGMIFIFVGIFTVSVVIAMPFYLFKKKYLKVSLPALMIEFLVTVFLTFMLFSYFFTDPLNFTATTSLHGSDDSYIVKCNEPIPEFTLGQKIIPSKLQAAAICSCIWKQFSPSAKNLSASIARDKVHDASGEQLRQFTHGLGIATETCNTMIVT